MPRTASLPIQVHTFNSGAKDAYGRPTKTWNAPVQKLAYGFDPGGSYEPFYTGREKVITSPTLYAPFSLQVGNQDKITIRGVDYEVSGDPAYWQSPSGAEIGVTVPLKKVGG